MKLKTCALAILLLLAAGKPARAVAASFEAFAGGLDMQIELCPAPLPWTSAAGPLAPPPAGSGRPLLILTSAQPARALGVFVSASPGRLTLLIATPRSSHATLIELRLNLRPLLAWLRSTGLVVIPAGCRAALPSAAED